MKRETKLSVLLVTTILVVSSASLGGAVLAGSPTAANAAEADGAWPGERADGGRTGVTNASGPSATYADTAWKPEGEGEPSGVAVADGTAYVGYESQSDTAVAKGAVVAHNATTGVEEWNRTDLSVVVGTPAVSGDTVFASTETITSPPSYDVGKAGLFAFDAETGETKWRFEEATDWATGATVADGTVYAISNRTLYALDAETGERRWSTETTEIPSFSLSGFAVADGSVYVTGAEGTVTAYDASDGSQQWNVSVPAASEMSGPAVSDGAIYVTAQPNVVYRLSADDGGVEWRRPVRAKFEDSESDWISAPAVTDETVYVTTDDHYEDGDDERVGAVHALDAKTGTEDWQFRTAVRLTSAPSVGANSVYVGGDFPTKGDYGPGFQEGEDPTKYVHYPTAHTVVYSLDRADGSERWSYATEGGLRYEDPFVTAPANGHVYVAENDDRSLELGGEVYALNGSETKPSDEHQVADDEPRTRDSEPTATIRTAPKDAEDGELGGNSTVKLRADASDEDDEIVTYEWDLDGDGTFETTGKRAEVTVPACGSVEVTLRVTSSDGKTATETITLDAGA
ncbi:MULTISPECIES: PQQ-binding-like beta-propeller repeat protein [Halorussus]|uniref:outer membrane protein assembly factor BamB family protein n=1 Tax=Halorussus TaxID=1070314 RepID=UPI0020A02E0E|nr:PQQ-binding-like beta-propeller repeat protein [Halorussus vallis]USZ74443.1 PQQ-binding-like beta-propeller repeat protein [Halorussus vallis]